MKPLIQTPEIEQRAFVGRELRAEKRAAGGWTIQGYAAVWNARSVPMYGFVERVAKGCFRRSIAEDDIHAFYNHLGTHVLGRNRAGTLRMREDDTGLWFESDVPETSYGADLVKLINRGDVSQCSFSFSVRANGDQWITEDDGTVLRTLLDVVLFDVGPTPKPAYVDTSVAVRSAQAAGVILRTKRAQEHKSLSLTKMRIIASGA